RCLTTRSITSRCWVDRGKSSVGTEHWKKQAERCPGFHGQLIKPREITPAGKQNSLVTMVNETRLGPGAARRLLSMRRRRSFFRYCYLSLSDNRKMGFRPAEAQHERLRTSRTELDPGN